MKFFSGNHVLLWEPRQDGLEELREKLARRGLQVRQATSLEEIYHLVAEEQVDLIVTRLCHSFKEPLELLDGLQDVASPPPVLIVTDGPEVNLYLEAMRKGAFDCVALPLNERELVRIVSRALEPRNLDVAAVAS